MLSKQKQIGMYVDEYLKLGSMKIPNYHFHITLHITNKGTELK